MKDFRSLKVWEKSHELTLQIYKATDGFPKHELYGVTSQIRRRFPSPPTSPRAASDGELKRFFLIAWDQPASWNTCSSSPAT